MSYMMLCFNGSGLGELQLGMSLEQIPVRKFNAEDRKTLVPQPDADSWYHYSGEITGLSDCNKSSFPAEAIYLSVNKEMKVNMIWIYPRTELIGIKIEEMLTGVYGPPMVSGGGMGEMGGMKNYTNYFYSSIEKNYQVVYCKVFNTDDFGPEFISIRQIQDEEALFKYRLVYRTWKRYM